MPENNTEDLSLYEQYYQQHPYYALLKSISDKTVALEVQKNLLSVNLFRIDLNAREIIAPTGYLDFIGVVGEHKAETITFQVDRYYEDVDLADMTIVIEYVNADGEGRVSPVIARDFTTFDEKILFDWIIDQDFFRTAGEVQFDVRFYMVGDAQDTNTLNRALVYSLRTRPFVSKVVDTLPIDFEGMEEEYADSFASQIETLLGSVQALEQKINNKELYWIDIT